MKNIVFIVVVSFILFSCATKPKAIAGYNYRIVKIDSIENTYLIYAERADVSIRNTNIIKIASEKTRTKCRKNNLINVDKNYKFNTFSLYPKDLVSHHIGGITYNGTLIPFDKDYNVKKDLFGTKDIEGLCYKYSQ
ncbi:hypothetical protein [Chryseobacterium sp.]|uniref:hypothetical protein n=1 Tax=Chryseobacterium sp. TaxID=1871047 RepID=UPI0012CEADBA|nr:hypothetical protein [Chryseobacterium sp.]MPS66751.1 hypothetical protein [Chryseobacterium sp.]